MSLFDTVERAPPDEEELALIEEAWTVGQLAWKLRPYQYTTYVVIWGLIESLRAGSRDKPQAYRLGTVVASRKIGKSFMEVLIACEFCRRYPGSVVRITAPTAIEARSIFEPEFEKVLSDCPRALRPRRKGIDQNWVFPNKSMIVLRGADMKPDRLRGPSSDLNFVDEAAYVTRLQYVVDAILYPMTINTKGPTILCSTLNQAPSGEFNYYYEKSNALGQASVIPITEAGFTDAELEAEKNAVNASTWAVEYMCEMGRDPDQTIVPEWTPEVAAVLTGPAPLTTPQTPELAYWHRLTAIDFGTTDNTVVLTGFLDFQTQTLWVTGEELLQGAAVTAGNVATVVKGLELADNTARPMAHNAPRVSRVGDHNIEMLQSLQVDHKLPIMMVNKVALEAMVNNLRLWISAGRLRIAPECVNLLACLKHGTWTTVAATKTELPRKRIFARTTLVDANRRVLGHFDALAAAIYLCLKAQSMRNSNPLPHTFVTAPQIERYGPYSKEQYGPNRTAGPERQVQSGWIPPGARKKR